MRSVAWVRVLLFGACVAAAGEATAGVRVSEKTRGYEISGQTGAALLAAMDRHGSIAFATEFARGIADAAHGAFDAAFAGVPEGEDRAFVEAMISWMLDRTA